MSTKRRASRPGSDNPHDGDGPPDDARLLDMLAGALIEDGELLPTTEDEVARLERRLDGEGDTLLPERLREPSWLV